MITNKKFIGIYVNIEILFDFRSYLFTLARYTNDRFKLGKHFNQNFFNSLQFNNINQFIDCLRKSENDTVNDYIELLKENIKTTKIFDNVKPRLYSLTEVFYLSQIFKNQIELILYTSEDKYLEVINKIGVVKHLQNLFNNKIHKFTIRIENNDCLYNELDKLDDRIVILIDYELDEKLRNKEQIVFYQKTIKTEDTSEYEKLLQSISIDHTELIQNFKRKIFFFIF